jgi:hypothetical protein
VSGHAERAALAAARLRASGCPRVEADSLRHELSEKAQEWIGRWPKGDRPDGQNGRILGLYGAPGAGKTTLAANMAARWMVDAAGSEVAWVTRVQLGEMELGGFSAAGEGLAKLRAQLNRSAPLLVVFDDIPVATITRYSEHALRAAHDSGAFILMTMNTTFQPVGDTSEVSKLLEGWPPELRSRFCDGLYAWIKGDDMRPAPVRATLAMGR